MSSRVLMTYLQRDDHRGGGVIAWPDLVLPPASFWRLHSQEEVFHHVVVIVAVAVWKEAGCKHDDGVVLRVVA